MRQHKRPMRPLRRRKRARNERARRWADRFGHATVTVHRLSSKAKKALKRAKEEA